MGECLQVGQVKAVTLASPILTRSQHILCQPGMLGHRKGTVIGRYLQRAKAPRPLALQVLCGSGGPDNPGPRSLRADVLPQTL
jgi:hypothetical protein